MAHLYIRHALSNKVWCPWGEKKQVYWMYISEMILKGWTKKRSTCGVQHYPCK